MHELTPAELGYLAGLIDGEGWIGLMKRKAKWKASTSGRTYYFRPIIVIGMAKRECLDYVAAMINNRVQELGIDREGEIYRLRIYPKTLRWLLPQLLPYLVLKRDQAQVLLDYMSVGHCWKRGQEMPDTEYQRRAGLANRMTSLNERPASIRRRMELHATA